MKKSVASALTAAIVLGVASTSFAAPTDEEVAELRARIAELERIIKEQNNSVAQNSAAQKREVENLNSRVDELEEKSNQPSLSDKFSIGGELRLSHWNRYRQSSPNNLQLRIAPTFKIDEHMAVKARFRGTHNTQNDARVAPRTDWMYLESKFDGVQVNVGKVPLYSNVDRGLFADTDFSGIQISTGEETKFGFNIGKFADYIYASAEVLHDPGENLSFGLGYHYGKAQNEDKNGLKEKVSVITGGVGYKLNEDTELFGAIAHNTELKKDKTAYNLEIDYKGADKNEKGTYGAYLAYRYAPSGVARNPTYNTFGEGKNKKGFEIGASWTPYKSIVTDIAYFHGKTFGKVDDRTFFARARAFF